MPWIGDENIYPQDEQLSMEDKLIGTTSSLGNRTRNYSLGSVFSLFYNFLGFNAYMNTTNTELFPIGTAGCMYFFDLENNITSDFNDAAKVVLSSNDSYNFNASDFFNFIISSNKFILKLVNLEDKNNFVFLNPSNFELNETLTSFSLDISVFSNLVNGTIANNKKYLIVLEFNPSGFNPADYNLSDFNNDLNLFSGNYNDLSNLPPLFSGNYNDLSGIPSTFNPSIHGHSISDISGLLTALSQKIGDAPSDESTYGRKNGNWEALAGGETKSFICHWQINQSIAASTSWYRQDPQVGIRGNFTTNASLTPTNAFANNIVLSPSFTLPFQAKIKSVTIYGWSNQGGTNIRFCVNSSKISTTLGITTPVDCLILADFSVNTQNIQVNGFRHEQTTGLNTTTLPALQEIRLFFNNNNVSSNIYDGLITVEFEKVS